MMKGQRPWSVPSLLMMAISALVFLCSVVFLAHVL